MNSVEEMKQAISSLSPKEYWRLSQWIHELDQARWDEQMDRDNASGKLDFLFREADDELAGRWPQRK